MYRRFCPDGDEDATVPRLNAIADTIEAFPACLIRLQNSGDAYGIKADADSLIENQQKLADVNDRLERSNKIAWQAERHNEELRGLLGTRDALEETLERNKTDHGRHVSDRSRSKYSERSCPPHPLAHWATTWISGIPDSGGADRRTLH